MKNKILIVITIILFIIGMIILSKFLNNVNKPEINEFQESKNNENKIEIIEVTKDNFEKEILNSEKTVLIDFYAEWCGPCKAYSPIIESIANEEKDIKVVKINVDEAPDIATKYQVMSIPTTVIIKNGEEVNRAIGVINKSNLIEMIK